LRSPLYFTNLPLSEEGSEPLGSPGLPIPQNSPVDVRHSTPLLLPTPPATTFFSTLTSQIERVVQQFVSPSRQRYIGSASEGNVLETSSGAELRNLSNFNNPLENLDFLRDPSVRKLFHTPGISPFDETHSTSEGLHAIGRPIGEGLISPANRFLVASTPYIFRSINSLNLDQNQKENDEGSVEPDSLQHEQIPPHESEPSLPENINTNQTTQDEITINRIEELLALVVLIQDTHLLILLHLLQIHLHHLYLQLKI
jgi:hypothetical protein